MRDDYYPHENWYPRSEYYPVGYREDEEMWVYDQCCDNCAMQCGGCPFEDDDIAPAEKKKAMKEDAVIRDQELQWCIYWEQIKRHRF